MRSLKLACLATSAVAVLATSAHAQAPQVFDIPAQPLPGALKAFGVQSTLPISFQAGRVQALRSVAVSGHLTPEQALKRMLKGSNLGYLRSAGGFIVVPAEPKLVKAATEPTPVAVAQAAPVEAQAQLDEIVVTAQKRTEQVQDVPAAVTAIASARLEKLGVSDVTKVSTLAPGLSITPVRSQAFVFMRGVGQTLTTPNADPAVAVNVNGVYVPSEMSGSAFYDLERVEVVPGPQGTLYGRNSTGGVINLITREPGRVYAANGFLELGDHGRVQAQVGADLPVAETLALRAVATRIQHDGYWDTGAGDQKTWAGRLTGVWRPREGTKVKFTAALSDDGGIGDLQQNIPATGGYRHLTFDPKALGYYNDTTSNQQMLEITQDLGSALTLTYLAGRNHLDVQLNNSIWSGPPPAPLFYNLETTAKSHELRLNGRWSKVDAILGLYAFDSSAWFSSDARPTATARALSGPTYANSDGWAVFGQATYSLTDALRVTGGLRYSVVDKDLTGRNQNFANGVLTVDAPFSGSASLKRTDWRAGVEYDLTPDSMVYASAATGFTPGGFSTAPIVVGQLPAVPFKPVYLTAYTVGIKNTLAEGRLILNAEAFHYDYSNYQVSQRNNLTGQNNVYTADQATIDGVQLDGRWRIARGASLTTGISYLQTTMDKIVTPAGDFSGLDLPFSPHWTANVGYQQTFDLSGGAELEALVNFQYVSRRWATYTHATYTDIEANTRTDLTLTYTPAHRHWSMGAWVRNLEDAVVKTQGNVGAIPGPASFFLEPPRTYGVRMTFNY